MAHPKTIAFDMQDEHHLPSSMLFSLGVLFTQGGCCITFWSTLLLFMEVRDQTQTSFANLTVKLTSDHKPCHQYKEYSDTSM